MLRFEGILSLPERECGLKQSVNISRRYREDVTPCMGVWIETFLIYAILKSRHHFLHWNVDWNFDLYWP